MARTSFNSGISSSPNYSSLAGMNSEGEDFVGRWRGVRSDPMDLHNHPFRVLVDATDSATPRVEGDARSGARV